MRKALFILSDLLDRDLIWLSKNGEVKQFRKGEVLIEEGMPVAELFFLLDGTLDVRHPSAGKVAELGMGDVIGEMSLVERRVPNTSVSCAAPCRILAVPAEKLFSELARNEGFAARFYHAMAVFLSDRLRAMTSGGEEDEVSDQMLDSLHVAGDRVLRLMDLLEGKA